MHQIHPVGRCTQWANEQTQWVREFPESLTQWGKKGLIRATYDKLSSARARL
jgi:hypothetical protein